MSSSIVNLIWLKLTKNAKNQLESFDKPLFYGLMVLSGLSLLIQWSAGFDFPGRFFDHTRNLCIAFVTMWSLSRLNPNYLIRFAIFPYAIGMVLLVAVFLFGDISKGAKRWLNIGITRIQPSEIMKIAVPIMLSWYFHYVEGVIKVKHFLVATLIMAFPVIFIAYQPDLGTAILVLAAGCYVIFFAGLSWKFIISALILALMSLPLMWHFTLHDYQKDRIMTLIDPSSDPLGKGFHIIQSMIAIGSGGVIGKGWLKGTQTHLDFIPEKTTDFLFSVYAEELGFVGNCLLIAVYALIITRGLAIASRAPSLFTRLLASSITMIFFTYAFVNIGMVSGILPVVGVPLPLMSYGGTAFVTLGVGLGILMSVHRHRKLVQT
jgi:rod shape determining protein RodA